MSSRLSQLQRGLLIASALGSATIPVDAGDRHWIPRATHRCHRVHGSRLSNLRARRRVRNRMARESRRRNRP